MVFGSRTAVRRVGFLAVLCCLLLICSVQVPSHASAIQELKLASQLHPGDPVLEVSLGQAYLDENHPDLAAPWFESALRTDKSSAAAMAGLGKVALSAGKVSEAIKYFESALEIQPQ